ncbi:MAG TPA: hypothetical protein VF945_00735, partial [Polyangia bacterium]
MARWLLGGIVLLLAGCASPQRLSASIYAHEQLAHELDASGEHEAAAAERRDADRERERLGGIKSIAMSRDTW